MINRYFQQELSYLRELGTEFSKKHPALAPMMGGGATDPDVERLLEGTAFLTALLRQKMDDDFPEFIHQMIDMIWPHYLRPIPSTTIIAFTPKPTVKQTMVIPAGAQLASVPVEGTSCIFRTCHDVEMHPLEVLEAYFVESSGRPPAIRLLMELKGPNLSDWNPRSIRFFIAGEYSRATDLFFLLSHCLKGIVLSAEDGDGACVLGPECLRRVGYSSEEGLLPYPAHAFPGYRLLQEYFVLPERFLFLDLEGWDRWKERGEGTRFEIRFELDQPPFQPDRVKKDNFVLSAAPAINIFPRDADPIRLDHRKTEYVVRPFGTNASHYQVYLVEKVVGLVHGTAQERDYVPFDVFNPRNQAARPVYQTTIRTSPLDVGVDVFLSVAYPPEVGPPLSETLSMDLLCTNGSLPGSLQLGDVCLPTSHSPEFADFKNIRAITANLLPPVGRGGNLLWRLLSQLSLNYLSLSSAENLRSLLEQYTFLSSRDRTVVQANRKRIAGIEDLEARVSDRLVSGIMMRGRQLILALRHDHFAGPGDLYLFGCVLDYFLGSYASINSFTELMVKETLRGDQYRWPARMGDRPLI